MTDAASGYAAAPASASDRRNPSRPFVVLDRDGTILVEKHYLSDPEQVELIPGVAHELRRLQDLGFGLVVVTNQSGVGRGLFDLATLEMIHGRLQELLGHAGVRLDAVYACPHTPDDGCRCRKPQQGLMERAAGELGFDPRTAFVVGDQSSDLEFGRRAGATTFLVRTGYGVSADPETLARADYVVAGLGEAVPVMESLRRVAAGREGGAEGLIRSVRGQLLESAALKRLVADRCAQAIVTAADLLSTVFREGGKLLLCGNGGSAADCQHMAAEFVSRLRREVHRPGLPAVALTTDTSFLTAFSNDAEFDGIFERQVSTLGKVGDGLIAISTSGSSRNIVRAVQMAKRMGVRSIALTGAKGLAGEPPEVTIAVPSADTQRIQEAHLAIEHVLCDLVEQRLFASR